MRELNIMEATVYTSPNPLTLICSLNEDGTTNLAPSALSPISPLIRRWWDLPPESSPTPASVCARPEKSSSQFPAKAWRVR